MPEKFKNKYRIESIRLQNWDYRWAGAYFVTICTKDRQHYFGKIEDGKMILSTIGEIVKIEWIKTFGMRPDMNLDMGEFVIMPNHFHAIILIGKNEYNINQLNERAKERLDGGRDAMHCVSTANETANETAESKNKFGPQSKNLASVIRGFKIGVTTNARKINLEFAWQPLFYDQIIRDEKSFENISNYIINNPANWFGDRFGEKE